MSSTRYATRVFGLAGVFNILVGVSAFVAPAMMAQSMGFAPPENPLFLQLAMWLVLVIGLGYLLTARNPERNRDLMLIGAVGKLFVMPLMVVAWRHGHVGMGGVAASSGDLIFALLFVDVMRRMPEM